MAKKTLKFASANHRQDHFQRHGLAVRAFTPSQYESLARRFLSAPLTANIHQKTRSNGDIVRYNDVTEEFAIMTTIGLIRTYFVPNPSLHGFSSNRDYYNAQ